MCDCNTKYTYEIKKKKYLEGILISFRNEIEIYEAGERFFLEKDITEKSSIYLPLKILFPYIDDIAHQIFKHINPLQVLKMMEVDHPEFLWEIYRNGILHSNCPNPLYSSKGDVFICASSDPMNLLDRKDLRYQYEGDGFRNVVDCRWDKEHKYYAVGLEIPYFIYLFQKYMNKIITECNETEIIKIARDYCFPTNLEKGEKILQKKASSPKLF